MKRAKSLKLYSASQPISAVVLISGRGSNLQAIVRSQQTNKTDVKITRVISNRADAAGLAFARENNINTTVIDSSNFSSRYDYDRKLIKEIDQDQPDLVILAGFMRILSPEFVHHYHGRLINIHPSLLPRFKGLHTHQQALDAEAKEHGASVHYVTEELDGGPVFLQAKVPVLENDNAESLAHRVLEREHQLYPAAVQLIANGRIQLVDEQLLFDQTPIDEPIQLDTIS